MVDNVEFINRNATPFFTTTNSTTTTYWTYSTHTPSTPPTPFPQPALPAPPVTPTPTSTAVPAPPAPPTPRQHNPHHHRHHHQHPTTCTTTTTTYTPPQPTPPATAALTAHYNKQGVVASVPQAHLADNGWCRHSQEEDGKNSTNNSRTVLYIDTWLLMLFFLQGLHAGEAQARICWPKARGKEYQPHQDIHRGRQDERVLIGNCLVGFKRLHIDIVPKQL